MGLVVAVKGLLLPDALTRKELSGVSRRWQTYVGRVVYVGLIGLIVFQFWSSRISIERYLTPSEYANLGRELFYAFIALQMTFATLSSISAASDMVTKEVRAGTLGLLVLTPLSARQIAAGKWKAAMTQSCSLILCGVPVLAICFYLGGVGLWELAWSTTLTLSSAAVGAGFSILYSATFKTATGAILMSLLSLVGYTLVPVFFVMVGGIPALALGCFVHPLYAVVAAVEGGKLVGGIEYGWISTAPASLAVAWFLVRAAGTRIRDRAVRPPPITAPLEGIGPDSQPARALSRLDHPGEVWEDRPLLWKELATRPFARLGAERRVSLFLLAFLFVSMWWVGCEGRSMGVFYFLGALFLILAILAGAALFAHEREGRKLEMLLSTPVTSWQIVRNKLAAGLVASESLAVLAILVLVAFGWSYWAGPAGFLVLLLTSGLFLLFAYALAAIASIGARSMRGAFLFASGVVGAIVVGLPVAESILQDTRSRGLAEFVVGGLNMTLNPVTLLNILMVDGPRDARVNAYATPAFLTYAAVYSAALAVLAAVMVRRFKRVTGRA